MEYSKSLCLRVLDDLINIYGQDFKNKQWLIEPFANVVSSIFIMHNCFLRYFQLEEGNHKNLTLPVMKLSICQQYQKVLINVKLINSHICEKMEFKNEDEKYNFCNVLDSSKLNYLPNEIALKKNIADELYRNEKYYLNT